MELWKRTGYFAGLSTAAMADAFRAAIRERDAAHEIALKKARADALEEAAVHLEHEPYFGPGPVRDGVLHAVHVLRALLEEAGK